MITRTVPDLSGITRLSDMLTAEYLEEYRLLPLAREDGTVLVAHGDSPDPQAVSELGSLFEASVLANAAASVVVGKTGTATVDREELLAALPGVRAAALAGQDAGEGA